MGMPIFMHAQLWKWTVRWSQLIARPGGVNASLYRPAPEECYDEGTIDEGLPMPAFPEAFWRQPWEGSCGERRCLEALEAWDHGEGPPYGRSPFGLYTADRKHLQPLDSAAFWSLWSEMALLPHTIYFDSASHLLELLATTDLQALRATSAAQRLWHRKAAFQVVDFWRGLVGSLLAGGAEAYKGSCPSAAAARQAAAEAE